MPGRCRAVRRVRRTERSARVANAFRHAKPVRRRRHRNRPGTPQPSPAPAPATPRTCQTRTRAAQEDGTGARTASPPPHQRSISAASPTGGDPRATAPARRDRAASPAGDDLRTAHRTPLIPTSAPGGFQPARPAPDCLTHAASGPRCPSTAMRSNGLTERATRLCPGDVSRGTPPLPHDAADRDPGKYELVRRGERAGRRRPARLPHPVERRDGQSARRPRSAGYPDGRIPGRRPAHRAGSVSPRGV